MGELLKGLGAALAAMVIVPLGMLYGIFVLPWIKVSEEWGQQRYGSAIFYLVFAGWPMWAILLIAVL